MTSKNSPFKSLQRDNLPKKILPANALARTNEPPIDHYTMSPKQLKDAIE